MNTVKFKNVRKTTCGMRFYAYLLVFILLISCEKEQVLQLNDLIGRWELSEASFGDAKAEKIVSFKFIKNSDQSAELSIDNWRNYYGFQLSLASAGKLTSKASGQAVRYEDTSFSTQINTFLKGDLQYTIKGDTMVIKNQTDWVKVTRLKDMEPSFCTKENAGNNVVVYVLYPDGSKVDITDFKVIRISDNKDVKPVRDPALKSGNLSIAANQNADYLYDKDVEVQFQGFQDGKMVASKNYLLASDCGVWLKVGTSYLDRD
ncbi:MAG: hypothetical protein HYZ44_11025, partial [Bacteroidetes bacterium]|nr:hypothetical protein [Bacteroidota bacterium]